MAFSQFHTVVANWQWMPGVRFLITRSIPVSLLLLISWGGRKHGTFFRKKHILETTGHVKKKKKIKIPKLVSQIRGERFYPKAWSQPYGWGQLFWPRQGKEICSARETLFSSDCVNLEEPHCGSARIIMHLQQCYWKQNLHHCLSRKEDYHWQ